MRAVGPEYARGASATERQHDERGFVFLVGEYRFDGTPGFATFFCDEVNPFGRGAVASASSVNDER
jgi:hypothetical protein